MEKKIILDTSDDAAKIETVTGWMSRNGRFWGKDERAARYDGSTHRLCSCGEVIEKQGYCRPSAASWLYYERSDSMLPAWQPSHEISYRLSTTSSILNCHWCGIDLSGASTITYLNGNLPCCDICLNKVKFNKRTE